MLCIVFLLCLSVLMPFVVPPRQHAVPAALATLHNSLSAFASNLPCNFTSTIFPIEYKISRPANNVAGYVIVLMVVMSFAPGFPAYVAVQERVTKSRHLLRVISMRPSVYWCTYYGFDLLWQCVSAIVHLSAFSHTSCFSVLGIRLSSPLLSSPSLSRSTASLTAPSTRCALRPPTTSCSFTFSPFCR